MKDQFSICIITKNEKQKLEHCLSEINKHLIIDTEAELVVVDTGSTDESLPVAKMYGAKTYRYNWNDNFADAKNFAIGKASNDWVFVLDTDEYIIELNKQELIENVFSCEENIGYVCRKNHFISDDQHRTNNEWIPRLFSRKRYHYEGRIHEQLVTRDGNPDHSKKVITSLTLDHDGYLIDADSIQKKADRNIRLLLKEKEWLYSQNESDEKKAYVIYQLGKSYYFKHEYAIASEYFEQGLSFDLDETADFVIDMVVSFGYALINSGQEKKALSLSGVYDTFSTDADYLFVMGLIYMKNAFFDLAIETFKIATKCTSCRIEGVNDYLANYNIGVIYECLNNIETALDYYKKCGNYDPAIKRYHCYMNEDGK